MKSSHAANDDLFDRTREVWQPRIGRNLTDEDARRSPKTSLASSPSSPSGLGLRCPPTNDTGKPAASENGEARHDR